MSRKISNNAFFVPLSQKVMRECRNFILQMATTIDEISDQRSTVSQEQGEPNKLHETAKSLTFFRDVCNDEIENQGRRNQKEK